MMFNDFSQNIFIDNYQTYMVAIVWLIFIRLKLQLLFSIESIYFFN